MWETLGFEDREGVIYPRPLTDPLQHDSYTRPIDRPGSQSAALPARWQARYFRTGASALRTVSQEVLDPRADTQVSMALSPQQTDTAPAWQFDQSVALRFQEEAENHIPDYQRVIDLGLEILAKNYGSRRDLDIIDVGSALGHTLQTLAAAGYASVWGVDNSEAMRNQSWRPERVFLSSHIKLGRTWDVILANWTLHFVAERAEYLEDIFTSLNPGGTLIISDKMTHTQLQEDLYYDFKRRNGVAEAVIQQKRQALVGVLTSLPLDWYLSTLKRLGFSDVEVVNSRYMFHTIHARKL